MDWTQDECALATRLWSEGKSATEVAREVSATGRKRSRNSIISKVHRLGVAQRKTPSRTVSHGRLRPLKPEPRRAPRIERAPRTFEISANPPVDRTVKPRKFTNDPASQIAAALLASADSAQRRRDQIRSQWR